jgi:hypothetical protein
MQRKIQFLVVQVELLDRIEQLSGDNSRRQFLGRSSAWWCDNLEKLFQTFPFWWGVAV